MTFFTDIAIKLFFLFSTVPFLLSEKFNEKYQFRLSDKVVDSLYSGPVALGGLDNRILNEASGLVSSSVHPYLLYTHNDSGSSPEIYLIDTVGRYQGKIHLEGASNKDWEDIAMGPGPNSDISYVYVGDIGDNDARREKIHVYRFPEPSALAKEMQAKPEKFTLQYPDGARDAETMLVDPWSGDIFILSKRDTSNVLYRAPAEKLGNGVVILEKVMKLPITMTVAGDISADGNQILIKNYWVIYYWERNADESIPEVLARKPVQLPYKPEPQGEAIGFSRDGNRYYTLSENRFRITPVLYQYLRIRPR